MEREHPDYKVCNPLWKRVINTALRAIQTKRRPARLWVIITITHEHPGEQAVVRGFAFGRVEHT